MFKFFIPVFITTTSKNYQRLKDQRLATVFCNRTQSQLNTYECENIDRPIRTQVVKRETPYKLLVLVISLVAISLFLVLLKASDIISVARKGWEKIFKHDPDL
ncbi:hypothetical protein RF11_04401 [Thelohanellus kitauei]|uniref:Uncharacterized protein n=1 Tax=Thelohanellus kitauei TaxID=669202 RepID=A0A0C2M966_THEKT|nr:hypothetical protein RF11_04401 [Thelohanellus kitauei]